MRPWEMFRLLTVLLAPTLLMATNKANESLPDVGKRVYIINPMKPHLPSQILDKTYDLPDTKVLRDPTIPDSEGVAVDIKPKERRPKTKAKPIGYKPKQINLGVLAINGKPSIPKVAFQSRPLKPPLAQEKLDDDFFEELFKVVRRDFER